MKIETHLCYKVQLVGAKIPENDKGLVYSLSLPELIELISLLIGE